MELKRLDRQGEARFLALYHSAFPREERTPDWLILRGIRQDRAEAWDLTQDGTWLGLAYVVTHGDLAYLFYLAIDAPQRGKGYGTQAMAAIRERYKGRLFLALEELDEAVENYPERLRRHAFYEACGLHDLPYRLQEGRMIYALMGTGPVSPAEYKALIGGFLGWVRHFVLMRLIP